MTTTTEVRDQEFQAAYAAYEAWRACKIKSDRTMAFADVHDTAQAWVRFQNTYLGDGNKLMDFPPIDADASSDFASPVEALFQTIFRRAKEKPQRFIYLVWSLDREAVKIGFSKNPAERFKTLKAASPDDLVFVGCIPGGRKVKSLWKRAIANNHIKGDWFDASDDQILHHFIRASLEADGVV